MRQLVGGASASPNKRPLFHRGRRRSVVLQLAASALLLAWFGVTLFLLSGISGEPKVLRALSAPAAPSPPDALHGLSSPILDATTISVRGATVDPAQLNDNQWHAAGNRSNDVQPGGEGDGQRNLPEGTPSSHTQPPIDIQREGLLDTTLDAEISKAIQQTAELPSFPIDHRSGDNRPPLSDQAISQCHKALWHTLDTTTYVLPNNETFVITGDIRDLWLRDSAAQVWLCNLQVCITLPLMRCPFPTVIVADSPAVGAECLQWTIACSIRPQAGACCVGTHTENCEVHKVRSVRKRFQAARRHSFQSF